MTFQHPTNVELNDTESIAIESFLGFGASSYVYSALIEQIKCAIKIELQIARHSHIEQE